MLASAYNSKTPMLQPMGFAEILDQDVHSICVSDCGYR